MMALPDNPRAWAATWRDESGADRGATFGGTMCWFPVKPGRLVVTDGDFEHLVPCNDCPGCRELARRRLGLRLAARYAGARGKLFLLRIAGDGPTAARAARRLFRTGDGEIEPGFYRFGPDAVVILCRFADPLAARLRKWRIKFRVEPIKFRRGARAWRPITAGLLVPRESYGAQVKRYYSRGLPPAEKKTWEVVKLNEYRKFRRATGWRARKAGNLFLVPPEVWSLNRIDRRSIRKALASARTPEIAATIAPQILALVAKVAKPLTVSAVPTSPELVERNRRLAIHVAAMERPARSAFPNPNLTPPFLKGGVTKVLDIISALRSKLTRAAGARPPDTPPPAKNWLDETKAIDAARHVHEGERWERARAKMFERLRRMQEAAAKLEGK